MNNFFEGLICVSNGKFVFAILQTIFVLLWINAERIEKKWFIRKSGVSATVKRGEPSIKIFFAVYAITSLIAIELISVADFLNDHQFTLMVINLTILTRLSFYNSWFRNKIVGLYMRMSAKEEFA